MPQTGVVVRLAATRQQGPQARRVVDFLRQHLPDGGLEADQEFSFGMKARQVVGRGLGLPVLGQSVLLPQNPPENLFELKGERSSRCLIHNVSLQGWRSYQLESRVDETPQAK